METLKRMPFKARMSVFEKLEKIVDIASMSKEERTRYDESIKVYRDQLVTISFAEETGLKKGMRKGRREGMKKGMEKGRKEGMKEGMEMGKKKGIEEGIEKGMEKGIEKGRKENSLEMAHNLKKLGVPAATISQASGLSIDEIERI